ncbi:MAG: hypothetical protein K2L47_01260, partial [Clostridia bacterium]|nr:hypothetical protein [Clostridia bacterium]
FVVGLATINLYGGKIHDNHADNSGTIDCNNGYFNMYGGEAYNNNITTSGSFMYLLGGNGEAKIYGGKIYNNHTASTNNGAIYINSTAQLWIGAGAQIYGNTAGTDNHAANVFLFSNQKINVLERLINSKENAHVGVTLYNYSDDTFTEKYSVYNSDVNPALYFFMSNSTQGLKILDGEVAVDATLTKPTQQIEWYWNSTQKTTSTNVTLPYIGSNYVIKSSLGSFWSALEQKSFTEYEIKNVGTYSFCVINADTTHTINYINPVFNVTITPKVVDIEWNNSLTYNGYPQSPTAVVKQGSLLNSDTCTVSVSGSAQNVGTGYVAKATGLSNSNYKINPETNSTFYSINPAELEINIITNNKNVKY